MSFRACVTLRGAPRACRGPLVVHCNKDFSAEAGSLVLSKGQLKAERYIATNRFEVKPDATARFEARWATRKSKVAILDGFRFFTLLRRVPFGEGADAEPIPDDEANYVSFTIWDEKKAFDDWRTGEAFKEAHGGGTLWGFVDMLVNATQTLKGAPKPAFYEGLIPVAAPPNMEGREVVDGWRVVAADGVNNLDAECFVAMNRFKITEGREADFEQMWADRESTLLETDGFKSFVLSRRDAVRPDDGFQYSSMAVWQDRAAFNAWNASRTRNASKSKELEGMFDGRPSGAFYEGVLVLESEIGA